MRYARDVQLRALVVAFVIASSGVLTGSRASAFVPPNQAGPKTATTRWAGAWNTDYGVMHLVQTGAVVTGDYSYGGPPAILGKLEGRADGLTLRLRWSESPNGAGTGDATFHLADNGLAFAGSWTSDTIGAPGSWNGSRVN